MWKFPFLPSFDFCPFKAKDKDSLLACCEEIVSCRDFIRVTVAEHRKARASSTNSNKLVSLLSLMLLDFKSLKRNISSEGHDSKDSEEQWVNNQLKSITAEMNWTLKGSVNQICHNLLITLHGQVLANYPNPHQPVLQAEPNHQSAIIYIDIMRNMLEWKRSIEKFSYQTQRKEPGSTVYSKKSESCHKNIAHLSAPWTWAPMHAFQTSVPPVVAPTFGFHIAELWNPSVKIK